MVKHSDDVIRALMSEIGDRVSDMFKICEGIALLDMLASFSYVVTRSLGYVKPELTDALALKAARHPILEAVRSSMTRSSGRRIADTTTAPSGKVCSNRLLRIK